MQLLEFHCGGCPTRSSAGAVNQAPESRGCQGLGNFADWLEIRGSGFFIPHSPDHRVLLRKSSQLVGGVHASKLKEDGPSPIQGKPTGVWGGTGEWWDVVRRLIECRC